MRDIKDLEKNAFLFWPPNLLELEADLSIIPKLIETQDEFISLLVVTSKNPFAWKEGLDLTKNLPANLFIKHLMVLADVGGEKTMRLSRELEGFLGNELEFYWNGQSFKYNFQTLSQNKTWSNKSLKVDGDSLIKPEALSPIMEDVANFILHAGTCINAGLPHEFVEKCVIGSLIGKKSELEEFVKKRYIWVSRITGGATSNKLGHLAQDYVIGFLKTKLRDWNFDNKTIPGISQNERTNISFDIVAQSPKDKICAIELSFQVTTNSVIERKAGQARDRQKRLHDRGHKMAYIIDGSGNFTRSSALATICRYSDCTVTFKESELDALVKFLNDFNAK